MNIPHNIERFIEIKIAESITSIDKDILTVLDRWYEAYQKIITFLGSASGIVLLYMGLHLIELIPDDASVKRDIVELVNENRHYIYLGVGALVASIISMIICLISTYNWYKTGLRRILTNAKEEQELKRLLGDSMHYTFLTDNMKVWGAISLTSGMLTGVCFAIGIVIYTFGVYEVFLHLLQ